MRFGIGGWIVGTIFFIVVLNIVIQTVTDPLGKKSLARKEAAAIAQKNSEPVAPAKPKIAPRDQHLEASRLLSEARLSSENALEEIAVWNSEILPVLENVEGDNIATDQDLVEKLTYVIDQNRMTEAEIGVGLEQIEQMNQRVDELTANETANLLSAHEINRIRQLHTESKIASNSWSKAVRRATAIIRQSNRQVAPPAQATLHEQMEKASDVKVLSNLSDEQINGPSVEETISLPTDILTPSVNPQLREQALSSDVKTTLTPFLEKRNIQPRLSGASIRFQNTLNAEPMSLSRLSSMGALNDSIDGLKRLVAIGANRKLPEPKWHIHTMPNNWSDDDREFLKKAQKMLRDYGQLLVDEGLLSQ